MRGRRQAADPGCRFAHPGGLLTPVIEILNYNP
jgi:hypothetical protein